MDVSWTVWGLTIIGLSALIAVDFFIGRKPHDVSTKEAGIWTIVWIALAVLFGVGLMVAGESQASGEFFAGFITEKSLSVDNLFVFALIFAYFKVPREYQHRVLFFGVVGALVFRAVFLTLGVAVVNRFTFVLFLFAAILFYSSYKILSGQEENFDPGKSFAVRMLRKVMPVQDHYSGTHFVVREEGRRVATPLLAVVAAIEAADLIFAVDSVPAVLAVS
ncbi:tellurium resistance protein TerC, partial [Streptomyces albus subsp. albus]